MLPFVIRRFSVHLHRTVSSLGILTLLLWGIVPEPSHAGPSTLDRLLAEIPELETGDENRYCITDVQYAMDADLSWNPLLKRAVLRESKSGLSFTIIVESVLGRIGPNLVEWKEAPAFHDGQIYVSADLLARVLEAYPDFHLPGEAEAVFPTPTPATQEALSLPPQEESSIFPGDSGSQKISRLLVVFCPSPTSLSDASGTVRSASSLLVEELESALKEKGISLDVVSWVPGGGEPGLSAGSPQAMIAFRIEAASPTPKTVFFTYESVSPPGKSGTPALFEWNTVAQARQTESRQLAEDLYRNYTIAFGEERSVGLRSAPLEVLERSRFPAVLIQLGLNPLSTEDEIRKTAQAVVQALSERE